MAWSRKKVDSATINGGNEYEKGSRVSRQGLNAMVNGGLYAQDFAEKLVADIDVSEIGNVGTPTVTLVSGTGATTDKPYKKFKFANFKGDKGEKGDKGDKGESGEIYQTTGTSTTGAMSQKATTDEIASVVNDITNALEEGYLVPKNSITNDDGTYSGFTQDSGGVLKAGDEIVSKRKLLWSGTRYVSDSAVSINLNETYAVGDKLEICMALMYPNASTYTGKKYYKFICQSGFTIQISDFSWFADDRFYFSNVQISASGGASIAIQSPHTFSMAGMATTGGQLTAGQATSTGTWECVVYEVWKIIE